MKARHFKVMRKRQEWDLRLTDREWQRRKARRKMARSSRKANR